MVPDDETHYNTFPTPVHQHHTPRTTCLITSVASPIPRDVISVLEIPLSGAFADIDFAPPAPTSLNATGLVGKLTRLGYLGSLRELDSAQSLHSSNFNCNQHYGYRRRKQTLGAPPENEASTPPHRPNQWSPFSPVLPFALHEYEETAFWLRFQTTSPGPHAQWCQWQCQWNGVAFKQSEERTTEAGTCTTKPEWERDRWAKGAEDDTGAICQNAAIYLEEVSEQTAVTHHTSAP